MQKKKVLMLAYQFPPMGGAGVQRTLKFAKYLPQFGWEPIIYTVDHKKGVNDPTLSEEVNHIRIIRTKSHDLTHWKKPFHILGKFLSRKLLIPDGEWLWYRKNRRSILEYVKEIQPDVIYSTSYPYSDHLLGLYVKKHYKDIPWVVDFRDEWTKNPYILDMNYSSYRKKIEQKMEADVVAHCDYFITNSPFMLDGFMEDYDLKDKSIVIPNGYDTPDFEGLEVKTAKREKLTMTYAGSMYGRRKPDYFLKALNKAIEDQLVDEDDILLQFVGDFSKQNIDKISGMLGNKKIVQFYPYMEHKKSIEFLLNSDVLLLIVGKGIGDKNFYTGKIFEYINTQKTILGLVPEDGAAAMVIEETKTGYVVDSTKVDEIATCIGDIYTRWKQGTLEVQPNYEAIRQYDRVNLTNQLSMVLEHVSKG